MALCRVPTLGFKQTTSVAAGRRQSLNTVDGLRIARIRQVGRFLSLGGDTTWSNGFQMQPRQGQQGVVASAVEGKFVAVPEAQPKPLRILV